MQRQRQSGRSDAAAAAERTECDGVAAPTVMHCWLLLGVYDVTVMHRGCCRSTRCMMSMLMAAVAQATLSTVLDPSIAARQQRADHSLSPLLRRRSTPSTVPGHRSPQPRRVPGGAHPARLEPASGSADLTRANQPISLS